MHIIEGATCRTKGCGSRVERIVDDNDVRRVVSQVPVEIASRRMRKSA